MGLDPEGEPKPDGAGQGYRIALEPELTAIDRAACWLEEIESALQLDPRALMRMNVCLEEILTNVVSYGAATGSIDVAVSRVPGRIVMEIADGGQAFDPLAREDPGEAADLEDAPDGGRGIRIVRGLTCASRYRREGDVNRLTLEFDAPVS